MKNEHSDNPELFAKESYPTHNSGPVTCLGLSFPNDEERRKYFLNILREKLKDPEFRKIEGFPIGSDEDILSLSDPPYYTACPNPFIADFIKHYGKPYDPVTDNYRREPFASDTGAGKTHPIYAAHSYHSKIPHLAIMLCILHYTEPGDIVLDGFSGSGMTGVAAQLCGQPEAEFKANLEAEWEKAGYEPPKWGARRPILIDLSPVANFIAYNLNVDVSVREFKKAADDFFKKIETELGWMYETLHTDGRRKGRINYVVWSEVFTCPNCAGDVVFMDQAYDPKTGKFAGHFECPHCRAALTTRSCEHKFTSYFDKAIGETVRKVTYVPVEIEYTLPGDKTKYRKKPDEHDLALINRLANEQPKDWFPTAKLPVKDMVHGNILAPRGITHYHQFYLPRALHALSTMWRVAGEWPDVRVKGFLKFMVEQCFWGMTMMNRYGGDFYSQVNRFLGGVFYLPTMMSETSPWLILDGKYKRLQKMLAAQQLPTSRQVAISTASSLQSPIPDKSVDYIYTDPPFGDAIPYGDLNLLIEAWHNLVSNLEKEVLLDKKRGKLLSVYANLMQKAFAEYYRVLKPGRWITVVFHNSKNLVWTVIQEAIGNAGFVVADVRTLDREQGSFKQVTAAGAVKQDLVISAYKPNGGLEERFKLEAGTEDGVWDFVRTHLKQLPVFVSKDGQAEIIAERQNYLLFDRMVAFHVQHGVTVPLSAAEFYAGVVQRFPERDGMFFLPEQVAEYDMKRMTVREVLQLQLFVTDEASAIQWLKQQLLKKPQTFQELHPQFLREIGGWQKYEKPLELKELLEQNFLCYDGKGEVPSRIHSYLSSNFKELRNLPKDDEHLRAKGKDCWYVPDPNKASDLEKLREKSLLKEFEEYRESSQKRLRVFRLEAVRAGFKKAWQEHDYATIITVANKIPENVLQEDPTLIMWYDQAMTRMGGEE
ncbi:MAG: DNA methylase [Spirochaetes bacterium ADurb.Bin110]|nr:MAG: DNA methylase [Spirochaetes bacterium ADurb.Bin110]